MIDAICKSLVLNGPQTIPQLAHSIGCDESALFEPAAALILRKEIYLEVDGSLWIAVEMAA